MIEDRSYGKAELAMLYFPTATPRVALNRLVRWINRCPELKQSLCSGYAGKFSHFYTRQQVAEIIVNRPRLRREVAAYQVNRSVVCSILTGISFFLDLFQGFSR